MLEAYYKLLSEKVPTECKRTTICFVKLLVYSLAVTQLFHEDVCMSVYYMNKVMERYTSIITKLREILFYSLGC